MGFQVSTYVKKTAWALKRTRKHALKSTLALTAYLWSIYTHMKFITIYCSAITLSALVMISCDQNTTTSAEAPEKPTKHMEVPDVTTLDAAKSIFKERTDEIIGKQKLDTQELHEIHMSTYHLEKAVAYFAENAEGDQKKAAEDLAVVVEEIHLKSEGFKPAETKAEIAKLSELTKAFAASF